MAIRIRQFLEPVPDVMTLPDESIELRQVLQAVGVPHEHAVIEYRLSTHHNIWFATNPPTKSLVFMEPNISVSGTAIRHQIQLIATHAEPRMGSVQIDQTITDRSGQKTLDLCAVIVR